MGRSGQDRNAHSWARMLGFPRMRLREALLHWSNTDHSVYRFLFIWFYDLRVFQREKLVEATERRTSKQYPAYL